MPKHLGKYLNEKLRIGAKHALYHHDGSWYHPLKAFPGVLFDAEGYVVFGSEQAYENCKQLRRKKDVGVRGGIRNILGYVRHGVAEAFDVSEPLQPGRVEQRISRIIRNTLLGSDVKLLYEHRCQICGRQLELLQGLYSEVHHIRPLGRPHDGADSKDNVLCVCPHCHVLLDYAAIPLTVSSLAICLHKISSNNLDYHNALHVKMKKKFVI